MDFVEKLAGAVKKNTSLLCVGLDPDPSLMPDEIGTLSPGAWGDAVIFELREGQFQLTDSHGAIRTGKKKLVPVTVIKGGRVYHQAPHERWT